MQKDGRRTDREAEMKRVNGGATTAGGGASNKQETRGDAVTKGIRNIRNVKIKTQS